MDTMQMRLVVHFVLVLVGTIFIEAEGNSWL